MSEMTHDLARVVGELKAGQPVAIPTETVYGLAAIASQEAAVARVYACKQRPRNHPLILHVSLKFDLKRWVKQIPPEAVMLMNTFWPGPLTLVFERNPAHVLDCVTGGQTTVAIRCPAHPLTQAVLDAVGEPLVMPSANPFGKVSPTTAEHVQTSFQTLPLLILEGGRCAVGIESTIVSVLDGAMGQVLRPGSISADTIAQCLGKKPQGKTTARVSGGLQQHYQPNTPVTAFHDFKALLAAYKRCKKPVFILAFQDVPDLDPAYFFHLSQHPDEVAFALFHQLRRADALGVAAIYVQLPPDKATWAGVYDRMMKAAFLHV